MASFSFFLAPDSGGVAGKAAFARAQRNLARIPKVVILFLRIQKFSFDFEKFSFDENFFSFDFNLSILKKKSLLIVDNNYLQNNI